MSEVNKEQMRMEGGAAGENGAAGGEDNSSPQDAKGGAAGENEATGGEDNSSPQEGKRSRKEIALMAGRFLGAAVVLGLLVWYCFHPEYYTGSEEAPETLFSNARTYAVIAFSTVLIALCLIPNRLTDRANRIFGWVWFAVSPFAIYFSLLYLNGEKFRIEFTQLNRIALLFTFWFLYIVIFVVLLSFGSVRTAVIIPSVLVAALGIANCFVIAFRGMALSGGDLFSVNTAMTVVSSYEYKIDWFMFMEIFLTVGICIVSCKVRGFRPLHWKRRLIGLGAWCVFAGSFFHICCETSFLEDHDIRSGGFTHQLRYKQYDMLFTTLCTCFYMVADKPEGYSEARVQEIAQDYIGTDNKESADTPNLVVIMNESFADYSDIGNGIELSRDCMPFIHGLTENTIKGTAYASIFGANTPNSEYEFLTGNTMGFLPPTSVGFNVFVRGDMPSLASELKSAGYQTLAMHPYRGVNYRRHIVYPQIGFDEYYDRKNFISPKYIRRYISDESLYDRVIREYERHIEEEGEDTPFFSYNVTIQNHGGYTSSNITNLNMDISVKSRGVNEMEVRQHSNLMKASDDAFKELLEYFESCEEPVVVIMFGDHQASLGTATYQHLIGNEELLTSEELMEKYKVPFVAWANYDIEEEVIEKTSLNYLYSILADRLNLPMTGYQKYLVDLSEDIPVLAAGGYWTKDGEFYELGDETSPYFDRINDYHILEYNYILGGKERYLELFELP